MASFIGFDFGLSHIGMAVGQSITQTASPIKIIKAKNGNPNWNEIKFIVDEWQPKAIILGLPINPEGPEQYITKAVRVFAEQLKDKLELPIHLIDEAYSTKEARYQLGEIKYNNQTTKCKKVDALSACLILETWLHEGNS